jgi:hypothetical protein
MSDLRASSAGPPDDSGQPPPISPHAAQTGALVRAIQDALKDSIAELKREISETRTHSREDFHRLLYIFGAGFVAIAVLFAWGYSRLEDRFIAVSTKIDDKVDTLSNTVIKVDTKLGDLLERIPPAQTQVPRKP